MCLHIFPKRLFYVTFDCPNLPFPYTIGRVAAVLLILPPILWLYANAPPAYIFHMRVILRHIAFSLILTLMDEGPIFDVFLLTFIRSL